MVYTLIILAVLTILLCIAVCNVSGRESDRELMEWCRQMEEAGDEREVIFEIDERGEDESENNRCGEHRKGDDYGNAERVQESKT